MLKVSNRNTRARCGNTFKINNKDIRTTSGRRSGVFIVNSEQYMPAEVNISGFDKTEDDYYKGVEGLKKVM